MPQPSWREAAATRSGALALLGSLALQCASESPPAGTSAAPATGGAAGSAGSSGSSGNNGANAFPPGQAAAGNAGSAEAGSLNPAAGADTGGRGGNGNGGGGGTAGVTNGGGAACPGTATLCDDFEAYAAGATDLSPRWQTYAYSGTVAVDTSKPHAGKQALHVTTQAGAQHFADIIRQSQDDSAVVPKIHFGRVMLWTSMVPGSAHWSLTAAGGPTPDNPKAQLKYSHGGQFGKLTAGYSVRERPVDADGTFPLRGGSMEPGDRGPLVDCSRLSNDEKVPLSRWVCWEWKYDAVNNESHLWLDGVAQAQVDVIEKGSACVDGDAVWQGPVEFTKLIVGFEQYQDSPAQEVWFDDLAVGPDRIGCP